MLFVIQYWSKNSTHDTYYLIKTYFLRRNDVLTQKLRFDYVVKPLQREIFI